MSVRFASIAARDATAASDFLQQWRTYYTAGKVEQLLAATPPPRVSVAVGGRRMQFRWLQGFELDGVSFLACEMGGYSLVFFDQTLNDGKGNFLPAIASLTMNERCKLGSRRRVRDSFLRELITAARQQSQATRARA